MTALQHTLALLPEPLSVKRARDEVLDVLHGWGLAFCAEDIRLCVSELATNALRHGKGRVEVRLLLDDRCLRCEVIDESSEPPLPRQPNGLAGGGRGLHLVDVLIKGYGGVWGIQSHASPPGKGVFVEVPVPPGLRRDLVADTPSETRPLVREPSG